MCFIHFFRAFILNNKVDLYHLNEGFNKKHLVISLKPCLKIQLHINVIRMVNVLFNQAIVLLRRTLDKCTMNGKFEELSGRYMNIKRILYIMVITVRNVDRSVS